MLSLLVTTVCLLSGLGCSDEEVTAPRATGPEIGATSVVLSDSLCARVQFTITSATVVRTTFPNRATCPSGLVLIRGPAASWAQNRDRRLQLFVRLLNRSSQTLQLPVRLYLPANGTVVLAPAGTPASMVVALNADSGERGGGRIWFVGGTGTLAANDSTVLDTLAFNVKAPVTQAAFAFRGSAMPVDTSRPAIPTSNDFPDDSLHVVANPADTGLVYYRTIADVVFAATASGPDVRAFLAKYSARVVAGIPWMGVYTIQFPDPGPTWTDVQGLLGLMRSEPAADLVGLAKRRGSPGGIDSRYPADGAGHTRLSWLSPPGQFNWAFHAVRAPLAWGCETGTYGAKPRVGVLEWEFEASHPDLQASAPTRFDASIDSVAGPVATAFFDQLEWHGTATTGQLGAEGDNLKGIAGMIWRSDLRLYALRARNATARGAAVRKFIAEIVPRLIADKPRVITSQIKFGDATDTTEQRLLRAALDSFFRRSPATLFVQTAGDDGQPFTEQQISQTGFPKPFGLRAALLYEIGHGFGDRILFVAGTQPGNQYWVGQPGAGSTFISQHTEIAAPGADFELLGLTRAGTAWSSPFVLQSGTSFGAPMVAGVAAQLAAMDSTLSASEIKEYLLRGAAAPRLNPMTGVFQPPNPVQGAPETVYQLDAYGSLTLLSSERAGTPICGYEVSAELGASGSSIRLEPPGRLPVIYPVPGSSGPNQLSVAQGGRRIALSYNTAGGTETAVLDHLGTVLQRLTGIERVYLERDTADIVLGDTTNPAVTLTGPGRGPADANLHPLAGFRFGGNYTLVALEVSPTGEHVGYVGVGFIDFECVPGVPVNFFDVRAEVVPVAGGSPTVVWRTSNVGCDGTTQFATGLGWNHTGDAAAFAVNLDDAMGFFSGRLLEWQRPGSSVRNAVIPGTTITGARYSADDRTLTLYQPDIGLTSCQEAVHDLSASGFGDVIGNPISVSPTLCTYGQGRTVQPNLRPLSVTPPGLSIRRQATLRPKRLLARTN